MENQGNNPFREAKPHLASTIQEIRIEGKTEYICQAVMDAYEAGQITCGQALLAKDLVMARIYPHGSINHWLRRDGNGIPPTEKTFTNTQFFRHRWLDHLADEWDQGIRK